MTEQFSPESVPAELIELSKAIELRRNVIETEQGVTEEKEMVRLVLKDELFAESSPQSQSTSSSTHYLDTLDDDSLAELNAYIARIPELGMKKTIALVRKEQPFLIDAFHDALTDKLYDELKNNGLIS